MNELNLTSDDYKSNLQQEEEEEETKLTSKRVNSSNKKNNLKVSSQNLLSTNMSSNSETTNIHQTIPQAFFISSSGHQHYYRPPDRSVEDEFKDFLKAIKNSFKCELIMKIVTGFLYFSWISCLIFYSHILWKKSLESCHDDIIICLRDLKMKFFTIMKYIVLFGFIHFYVFIHSFLLKARYLKIPGILISASSFGYRAITSKGFSAEDHSLGNVVISGITISLSFLIFLWIVFTIKLFKKKIITGIIWLIFFVLICYYFYWEKVLNSCVHLNDSLDPRVKYSEEGKMCKWFQPKICPAYSIDGLFKVFYIGKDTCEKVDTTDLTYHKAT